MNVFDYSTFSIHAYTVFEREKRPMFAVDNRERHNLNNSDEDL